MNVRRNLPRRRGGPSLLSLPRLRIFGYAIFLIGGISSLCGFWSSSYKRKTILKINQQQQQQQTLINSQPPQLIQQVQHPRTMLRQEQEQPKSHASSPPQVLLNPLPLPASGTDVALTLPPSPVRRINLLFDDKANPVLTQHMVGGERVPVSANDQRFHLRHREVTVTILRPPGVFGSIIEGFVRKCIDTNIDDELEHIDFDIRATSRIVHPPPFKRWSETNVHPEHYYIHAMTLPVLLEAIDLVMLTLDDKRPVTLQSGGVQLTWQDFMDSVELLVRWHCRVSASLAKTLEQHDDSNYVMIMTLQSTLEHPLKAEIELLNFLGVTPADYDRPMYPTLIDRTNFTQTAWNRLHQATMLVRVMDNASLLPTPSWFTEHNMMGYDNVDSILSFPDQCPTDPYLQDRLLHSMTASVNGIQQLLNDKSLATVCQQLPVMTICRYKDESSYYPRLVRELQQEADPNVLFLSIFCQGHPERLDLCNNDELLLLLVQKNSNSNSMSQGQQDDDPATTEIVVMDQFLVQSRQQPDTSSNNNNMVVAKPY